MINKKLLFIRNIVLILVLVWIFSLINPIWLRITLIILVFSLWRCWVFRDNIILAIKNIETSIFGKPLDKDIWEKGELRDTKIKIVWGKNDKQTRN